MTGGRALAQELGSLAAELAPRAGSLAITLFGDYIANQGNSVWLGSLVRVMAEFGLNERQVRTAMFRLGQDGWLESHQRGRRSYYALSDAGQRQYARAAARIYAAATPPWDGEWTLVMPGAIETGAREELRKRLGWLGFGVFPNGMLAHPRAVGAALAETIGELGLGDAVIVWRARADAGPGLDRQVREAWRLDERDRDFSVFLERFERFADTTERLGGREAFVLRTLLIHEYRRILLRSVDLPPELLPDDWAGHRAMALVRSIYARVHAPATAYAMRELSNERGQLPPPAAPFFDRLGGLKQAC
ncbi:MAG: PaaX family transcriptional regulator [Gammaproteobacteria bacterium]